MICTISYLYALEGNIRVGFTICELGSLGVFFCLGNCGARSALRDRRPQLRNFLVRCKRGAASFMASFGSFWLRFGVRVRVGGWVFARTLIPTGIKIPEEPTNLKIRVHRLYWDLKY